MLDPILTVNAKMTSKASVRPLDGVDHLVVPVVALKEGVLNNMLYKDEEISQFAEAWNGVPIPVSHPTNEDGNPVTANSVDVENTQNIGRLYNVAYKAKKIIGEIWINMEKAVKLGYQDIVSSLESGQMMEVSTGLFSNAIPESGTFNGQEYSSIASGIRPDHLALLPDEAGACSIADGCGAMRNNCQGCQDCKCKEKEEPFVNRMFKKLRGIFTNEASHNQIYSMIAKELRSSIGGDPWPYVIDVYDSHFVYEVNGKLYKQSYTSSDTEVQLSGDPTEVVIKTEYLSVNSPTTNKKMDKEKLVGDLISNAQNNYQESDRESLMKLPDAVLEGMTPSGETAPATPSTPAAQPAVNSALSDEDRKVLEDAKAIIANNKASAEKELEGKRKLVANHYNHLDEEKAKELSSEAVEALHSAIPEGSAVFAMNSGSSDSGSEGTYDHPPVLLAEVDKG